MAILAADAYLKGHAKHLCFCLPSSGKAVPSGPDWIHEIKYDGFRVRLERGGARVRLITRGGYRVMRLFQASQAQPVSLFARLRRPLG